MNTITENYRALNAQLHAEKPAYGANGYLWGNHTLAIIKKYDVRSVLDYGAGKGTLKEWLRRHSPVQVQNYDPAIPEFAAPPQYADLVVCTDVMEHVEVHHTGNVLEEIARCAGRVAFFNISTRPAVKHLPDGRNAHINLRSPLHWFETVSLHFNIVCYEVEIGHSVTIVGTPLGGHHG